VPELPASAVALLEDRHTLLTRRLAGFVQVVRQYGESFHMQMERRERDLERLMRLADVDPDADDELERHHDFVMLRERMQMERRERDRERFMRERERERNLQRILRVDYDQYVDRLRALEQAAHNAGDDALRAAYHRHALQVRMGAANDRPAGTRNVAKTWSVAFQGILLG
jgi:hypothetical protein